MPMEVKCDGDHAGNFYDSYNINNDDEVYCGSCYEKLKDRIEELEKELEEKSNTNEELVQKIADLESDER